MQEEWRDFWSDSMDARNRGATGTLVSGLVIAGIGVIFLLDRFGIVDSAILWRLWPMLFAIGGVKYLMESSGPSRQVWGGFLISIGGLLTLHEFGFIHYGMAQLWPLFLIATGVMLAWHASEIREGRKGLPFPPSEGALNSVCIFGGIERKIEGKYFQGGEILAIFGGFKIDLSRADMEGDEAVIDASAVFGGGEIIVPETWRVHVEGVGIFGGYVDKTRHLPRADATVKTLHVRGAAVFGGIEVKSW